MERRRFIETIAGGLLAAPSVASPQQTAKVVRIGMLNPGASDPASAARWQAFRERLRELGYVEGQNVALESRWGDGQTSRLRGLAAELIDARADVLVTAGTEAALAARQATGAIPIVMATGGDPVGMGLAASLPRPGGTVTGVISLTTALVGKRLEILKQMVPRASRVAFVQNPDRHVAVIALREAESSAKSLGITVHDVAIRGRSDLDAAFRAIKRARTDAVILGENTAFIAERQRIADLAAMHRLPMMAPAKEYAAAGALVSYGTNYLDLFRRAAVYVDRILKGASPADLPIEQPTTFELVINLKTARALGLTIPQSLQLRADEVIQ